jgi:ABC-2 type transport system ATP-binding protein
MTSAVVTVDGLTRQFGSRRGVTDVSFEVQAGQVFGFLGPNGAGKSTTIRLLLGMYRADSGTMSVLGHDPARDAVALHRRVGYLPGELALHQRLTGAQHLAAFARARRTDDLTLRDELVERLGVELDRPVHTLSKGNRQKIGLVLAFMHRPELLILDEPTSGLDPLLQEEFARLVRETTADGRTVFLSSHELDEVQRLADQVAIIRDGRIVVTDTIEGLRRAAPRTIVFRFDREVDTARFTGIDGIEVTGVQAHTVALSVSGPLAPVLRVAADLHAVDVTARPADLDELFLRYYHDDRQEAHI